MLNAVAWSMFLVRQTDCVQLTKVEIANTHMCEDIRNKHVSQEFSAEFGSTSAPPGKWKKAKMNMYGHVLQMVTIFI